MLTIAKGYIALSSWSPWNSSEPKQLMVETMTLPVKFYPSHWQGVSQEGARLFPSPISPESIGD